ncbi:MAG: PQQ-binding-like beta-propeller repeat protein [Bryobacterales bacterium]|nr:PQQ-binding-like beta-propeller repeat protein [Bryobacterales bacterium]
MRIRAKNTLAATAAACLALVLCAADPSGGDWPMWGGTPGRNMVGTMSGAPTRWNVQTKENIKWVAPLGSHAYGNPVVSGGMVFVGTNNALALDPKQGGDRGVLMAFRESDGQFLWQHTSAKLATGDVNDWALQGVASSPLVEGDRLYYVSNRAELICLDTKGFTDGENDGPYTAEVFKGPKDADVVWRFDMIARVGTFPHNLANSSPVSYGDLVYVSTSNGNDESHAKVPSPKAPTIVAVNKKTGELVWKDSAVGGRILHGQWSSPAVGTIGDTVQLVSGQGDGWVRGFQALTGEKLWQFDLNPKDAVWPKSRNEVVSTPIVVDNVVYLASGQDPEHGDGVGHLYAIDATKRGDITQTGRIWQYDKIRRSISTGALRDGILYYADFSGFLHALDAKTGKPFWVHDTLAAVWGSPYAVDGKVYLGNEDGNIVILQAGKVKKLIAEIDMGSSVYSTPVAANNTLYVVNRDHLFAIRGGAAK